MSIVDYILAIDIGTSGAKAILYDLDSKKVSTASEKYQILSPRIGWIEQDPETVFTGVVNSIKRTIESMPENGRIAAVGFSSQLYSILAVDREGNPLSNSLTWSDTRSTEVARKIREYPDAQNINLRTGCPIHATFPFSKIKWLKENLDLSEQVKFVSIKEYVIYKLTNRWLVDWSVASATGIFDIKNLSWDKAALAFLNIGPENLSEVVPPQFSLSEWNTEVIESTNIASDTPLIICGGDGPLASLGVGAVSVGSAAINLGSSAAFRITMDEPIVNKEGRLWTFVADEGLWVMGGITSGGIIYDWFINAFMQDKRAQFSPEQLFEKLDQLTREINPGSDGLIFRPYISGQMSPDWDPTQSGVFKGIRFDHTLAHFVRAINEGLIFSLYRIYKAYLETTDSSIDCIYVSGRLSLSNVITQIISDVYGTEVYALNDKEGSSRGCFKVASLALGYKSNYDDFATPILNYQVFSPSAENHKAYQQAFQLFEDV